MTADEIRSLIEQVKADRASDESIPSTYDDGKWKFYSDQLIEACETLLADYADLERKDLGLCQQNGELLMAQHVNQKRIAVLEAENERVRTDHITQAILDNRRIADLEQACRWTIVQMKGQLAGLVSYPEATTLERAVSYLKAVLEGTTQPATEVGRCATCDMKFDRQPLQINCDNCLAEGAKDAAN